MYRVATDEQTEDQISALPATGSQEALGDHRALVDDRHASRFDVPGALTGGVGMTALVFGFLHAAEAGWGRPLTIVAFAAAIVLLAAFLVIESRAEQPIIPLSLFVARTRRAALACAFVLALPMIAMNFFVSIILQEHLGYTPVAAGFAFLPTAVGLLLAARLAARLLQRWGHRRLLLIGSVLIVAGMTWAAFGLVGPVTYFPDLLAPTLLFGLGGGAAFTAANVLILSRVSPATPAQRPACWRRCRGSAGR